MGRTRTKTSKKVKEGGSGGEQAAAASGSYHRSESTASRDPNVHGKGKEAHMSRQFDRQVRPYIDLIDSLRSLGLDEDISLPSVVVIGDQSTGKSSVLEAISGVQLPRGTGIVTRCALELRMKKKKIKEPRAEAQDNEHDPWKATLRYREAGEKTRGEVQVLEKPEDVGRAVEEAQNKLAGEGRDICTDTTILLDVESLHVPDLTLIDLPGIARVAGEGQALDIGQQTKQLIRNHIKKNETIILCVIPCNVDIATTEALQMAREFDPEGIRTLGVMTKPDLVDKGAEKGVVDTAQNQTAFKLKLGFTVVKCRGQSDISNAVTLQDALDAEKRFFKSHEYFNVLHKKNLTGIDKLAKKLTQQLVSQIRRFLPGLLKRVTSMSRETRDDLKRLGDPVPKDKVQHLITMLQEFSDSLKEAGSGRYSNSFKKEDKIYTIAHQHFTQFAAHVEELRPGSSNEDEYEKRIEEKIRNSRGQELPGFPSFEVFKQFAVDSVREIEDPAKKLLENVYECIKEIAFRLADRQFERFLPLKGCVRGKIDDYLEGQYKKALADIETLFRKEQWVFTQDKTFQGLLQKVVEDQKQKEKTEEIPAERDLSTSHYPSGRSPPSPRRAPPSSPMMNVIVAVKNVLLPSTSHKEEARELFVKLQQYNEVVRARLCDSIPMTVYYYLVTCFCDEIRSRLLRELTVNPATSRKGDEFDSSDESSSEEEEESEAEEEWLGPEELLRERVEQEEVRKTLTSKIDRLKKAEKKLHKFSGEGKIVDPDAADADPGPPEDDDDE